MKNILVKGIFGIGLCTAVLAGCTNNSVAPSTKVTPIEIPESVATGSGQFAFDFFKNLQATQPATENLFVSPLSLHMAMGMLLAGAQGETASEIKTALKLNDISEDDLQQAYKVLIRDLPIADSRVKVGLANSMWYKEGFPVKTDYTQGLKDIFNAEVTGLPFDATALAKINQWASDNTNKKIDKVLDSITADQVMFLLNALYFKGSWQSEFDPKNTKEAAYNLEDGTGKTTTMMFHEGTFDAASNDTYKALRLPYANGQFNMTLILPNDGVKIGDVMSAMKYTDWEDLQKSQLHGTKVMVGLPKFQLKYSVKLNKTLSQMGIQKVFLPGAELQGISSQNNLLVSFVKQDTFLGVDEEGTEAAAVTTIGIEVTSLPMVQKFICNKPFGLVISENTSNSILFMGRIMNPTLH
ncbi:serpin B [Dyadobacter jejuensis]|uniref:Serpin B n=1 Tax=Dyadobacter jejuensis TaxID=1082580 RepID=A0A316AFU4_9BACT|nr:serpin family protein [Dyadobacter jejuensis]PWJ56583.1 serpin B [Dyadobacter jejuensis]